MIVKREADIILVTLFIGLSFGLGIYLDGTSRQQSIAYSPDLVLPSFEINPFEQREALSPEPKIEDQEFFVYINNTKYSPEELEISVGSKVTWVNSDDKRVYRIYERSFGSRFNTFLDRGESFSFVFNEPGTYYFNDAVFTFMHGTVKVS